jgi:glycine/D-amino acid oxidase-like deaminating enzyme/nitrite reductase/ring-hydroxylating ferredoxin subunit
MIAEESGQSSSVWMTTADISRNAPLRRSVHADVCIIGAGMAGLSTAYCLAREGQSVVVVDDGSIGSGMTQRTTAHLSNVIDKGYVEIERLHGHKGACLTANSHTVAIDRIETIVAEERIACDFERVDGYLFADPGESNAALDDEFLAAQCAGITHVERLERSPVIPLANGPCVRFPRQAQFHPLHYLNGLAGAIHRHGGHIFTEMHVKSVKGGPQASVETDGGAIVTAGAIVVATNTPVADMIAVHTKQTPYMTYVIGARIPKGSVPKALYWDMEQPYHYVRIHSLSERDGQYDVLIVGGEDHKTGRADDGEARYAKLEQWARQRFPMVERVEYRWSGQVMEPVDGIGFIGRDPEGAENVYIATGDAGMGMTHGMIAGMLLADLIMIRESPWTSLYDPSRKTLRAAGQYVKDTIHMAAQYTDWVTGSDVKSLEGISKDSGAVIRRGLAKVAVYRDPMGTLHERSAVCPHLGCIVRWNQNEKTWDCPCHGSRFDKLGAVINGPANSDLAFSKDGKE